MEQEWVNENGNGITGSVVQSCGAPTIQSSRLEAATLPKVRGPQFDVYSSNETFSIEQFEMIFFYHTD